MSNISIFELGSIIKDKATNQKGMLCHLRLEMNNQILYNFQPTGLSPEDGLPLKQIWIAEERVDTKDEMVQIEIPEEVLGTMVEDVGSGYKGMAIALILHISGCLHIEIQSQGRIKKTNQLIQAIDIDIRRVKGEKIPILTKKEIEKDQERKPSPISTSPARCYQV